jgi:hypothetical protein
VNGITLKEAADHGLVAIVNGRLQMSLLLFSVINENPKYTVCPPELLDPHTCGWEHLESVAAISLLLPMKLRFLLGDKVATLKSLRPGCNEAAGELQVTLFDPPLQIPRCTVWADAGFSLASVKVGMAGEESLNLNTGGCVLGGPRQPDWDVLVRFPKSEAVLPCSLWSQAKAMEGLDPVTGNMTKDGRKSIKGLLEGLNDQCKGLSPDNCVVEVFTDKEVAKLQTKTKPAFCYSSVHKDNWEANTGPLFAAMPRLRPILQVLTNVRGLG